MKVFESLLLGCALWLPCIDAAADCRSVLDESTYSQASVKADLDQFLGILLSTHPQLDYTTDIPVLRRTLESIRDRVKDNMTTREIWREASILNPILADAHMGIRYPLDEFEKFRAAGGAVFPLPVRISEGARIFADHRDDSNALIPFGSEILSINGKPARDIISALMPRMRGETDSIQRMVMAHNFSAYLWALLEQCSFTVTYRATPDGAMQTAELRPSASVMPRVEARSAFRYRVYRNAVAYLDIPTFDIARQHDFERFLMAAFSDIAEREINSLVIDLRQNKGGAHELSDRLTGYLTGLRVRQASALIARITEQNRELAPDAPTGTVHRVALDEWLEPTDQALRFHGDIVLLIGKNTYSQAIVFAAMFQDYGLGRIAGEPTDGWANQTGQVQMIPLRHSGLLVAVPLYIIVRPNGDESPRGITPDLDAEFGSPELQDVVKDLLVTPG